MRADVERELIAWCMRSPEEAGERWERARAACDRHDPGRGGVGPLLRTIERRMAADRARAEGGARVRASRARGPAPVPGSPASRRGNREARNRRRGRAWDRPLLESRRSPPPPEGLDVLILREDVGRCLRAAARGFGSTHGVPVGVAVAWLDGAELRAVAAALGLRSNEGARRRMWRGLVLAQVLAAEGDARDLGRVSTTVRGV